MFLILYRKKDDKPISIRVTYKTLNKYKTYTEKIPKDILAKRKEKVRKYADQRVKAIKKLMNK